MLSTIVGVVIIVWFVLWVVTQVPRFVAMIKSAVTRAKARRLVGDEEQLKVMLEKAKHTAELDWTLGGSEIAEQYLDQRIAGMDIPDSMIVQAREENLSMVRNAYIQFVVGVIVQDAVESLDSKYLLVSQAHRQGVETRRELRSKAIENCRETLVSVGYDPDELANRYATATAG